MGRLYHAAPTADKYNGPMADAPWPPPRADSPLAILLSGGSDSAVLLGEALTAYRAVHPIFVLTGAIWESAERDHVLRFLAAVASPALRPLVELRFPVADLYGDHWSLTGRGTPDEHTADDAVYLAGRNVILLTKALLWCHFREVPELATATLASNPFPDATDAFYAGMAEAVNRSVNGRVRMVRPYAAMELSKADVLKRGASMPLQHTFSCIRPVRGQHCGRCNKCAERRRGFADAGLSDPTAYN